MYIDIHTHQLRESKAQFELLNTFLIPPSAPNQAFSLGLHPWFVNQYQNWEEAIDHCFEKAAQNPMFWAIGEVGLDKCTDFPLDLQTAILNHHYQWAVYLKKPMILHVVRAFDQLFAWKKKLKTEIPMLVHGFVRKKSLLQDLVKAGFYVSFGAAITKDRTALLDTFRQMPEERLFLETDHQNEISIQDIYEQAAILKQMEIVKLKTVIIDNFNQFFNKNFSHGTREKTK